VSFRLRFEEPDKAVAHILGFTVLLAATLVSIINRFRFGRAQRNKPFVLVYLFCVVAGIIAVAVLSRG